MTGNQFIGRFIARGDNIVSSHHSMAISKTKNKQKRGRTQTHTRPYTQVRSHEGVGRKKKYRSCRPILATTKNRREEGYYPRVWWLEKHYWADSERALWAALPLHHVLHQLMSHCPFHLSFHHSRCDTALSLFASKWLHVSCYAWWLAPCDLGDPGWGDPWFPHGAFVASLTS